MFIPRSLRVKNTEKPTSDLSSRVTSESTSANSVFKKAKDGAKLHTPHEKSSEPKLESDVPEYLSWYLCGIELIFTDHAHKDRDGKKWLTKHYRIVDGEDQYVHLSAILDHPNISSLKPAATQLSLQQAIEHEQPGTTLELSRNGYYVRRKPSTYPLTFIPDNAASLVGDDGLSFWDERTIYVEPHSRALCNTPARVAWWLREHGQMRQKWLPIQAVITLYNSCAFVILSGNVTHTDVWNKWRSKGLPKDWKIMTKAEHSRRTAEYLQLLEKDNPKMIRRLQTHTQSKGPSINATNEDKPSQQAITSVPRGDQLHDDQPSKEADRSPESPPTHTSASKKKRKRNHKKKALSHQPKSTEIAQLEPRITADLPIDPTDSPSTSKHLKLSHRDRKSNADDKTATEPIQREKTFQGSRITFDE